MSILPEGTLTTVTTQFTSVIGDNIVPIIGVMVFGAAVSMILSRFTKTVRRAGK